MKTSQESEKENQPQDLTKLAFDLILDESFPDRDKIWKLQEILSTLSIDKLSPLIEDHFIICLWTSASISSFHLDLIFRSLKDGNTDSSGVPIKPVLLIIRSSGGQIEPAYQISKICRLVSNGGFLVCLPREAKSAATLIALGADEIHMGHLSQLGPIDPQINGFPALGLKDSLREISDLVTKYPASSEMFALYLKMNLHFPFFGWCTRLPESAIQYAEKLLSTNKKGVQLFDSQSSAQIADTLVNHYKDHGFVIDAEEATAIFGDDRNFIKINTDVMKSCEKFYDDINLISIILSVRWDKNLEIIGFIGDKFSFRVNDEKK
ncbi:MAG: SDH family Clp fold serine proteinase [Oligoflexus sp.]